MYANYIWICMNESDVFTCLCLLLNMQMRRSIKDLGRPMYRKDIFYSGSIRNLPEFRQSSGDVRSYIASVLTLPGDNPAAIGRTTASSLCFCLPTAMRDTLGELIHLPKPL